MGRQVVCVRPIRFFRTDFRRGELVDVDVFANNIGVDATHLFGKMIRPQIQVGREMVSCFEVADDGGTEELVTKGTTPPPTKDKQESELAWPIRWNKLYWQLSSGDHVAGRKRAMTAQAELDAQ